MAAAEALQTHIEKASGAKLPIVAVSQAPADGTLVLVGRSALTERFGIPSPAEPEGLRIHSFPRGLAILGEIAPVGTNNWDYEVDRGTLHGVVAFLEDYLGFRFYFHGTRHQSVPEDFGVVIPDLPTIALDLPIEFTDAPYFAHRTGGVFFGRRGSRRHNFNANHTHLGWDEKYKETHPEYFAMNKDGTRNFRFLCYSEPGVLQRELEHIAEAYASGKMKLGWATLNEHYIPVEPPDHWSGCYCQRCLAKWDPSDRFSLANLWFDYVNRLAAAVKQRWPDKRIATLAYQGRRWPPACDIADNVDVMVCMEVPGTMVKEPEVWDHNMRLVRQWYAKLGQGRSRLYVWDYYIWPTYWICDPIIFPHSKQRWLQECRDMISGEHINGGGTTLQESHFMSSVWFKLLWDPDMDVDAYLTDYCQHFFGPAAGPMEQLYRLLISRYENTIWPENAADNLVSEILFHGQTYTPEVIEALERYLAEAQAAVGEPALRTVEFAGEGWMLRRNAGDVPQTYSITLTNLGATVNNPALRWDDGSLSFRGELLPGTKLVIEPGPVARVYPAELVQEADRLSLDKPIAASDGHWLHKPLLYLPVKPGERFRISITGKAADGGNSSVVVRITPRPTAPQILQDRLGSDWRTVSEVFTIPDGISKLEYIGLLRHEQVGTVWYGGVSVKRDMPEHGLDVTDRLTGTLPRIDAQTSQVFHYFHDGPPGEGRMRITMSAPVSIAQSEQPSIYQQRVLWMREGFEDYHPASSTYGLHDGFLVAAKLGHRSLARGVPTYRVAHTSRRPRPDISDPAWLAAAPTYLVRGTVNAVVPLDNIGFPPDVPTCVKLLQDGHNVYVAFRCTQPEAPSEQDSVGLTFFGPQDPILSVACRPDQTVTTDAEGVRARTQIGEGFWAVFLTIPKRVINAEEQLGTYRADLWRTRTGRNYIWSPGWRDAPWVPFAMSRRGKVVFSGG